MTPTRFAPAELPQRISRLPVSDTGFPIPYFAAVVDDLGTRDFRVVDPHRMAHAVRAERCWVCGERLGAYKAFVIGPMCVVNRTISDPPSHRECATFSAKYCPFLSRPLAKRNTRCLPDDVRDAAGFGIKRNPGAVCVWITKSFTVFRPHAGNPGLLFEIGDPEEALWFASGQPATRAEVEHSIDTGLPLLREVCDMEVDAQRRRAAHADLDRRLRDIRPIIEAIPNDRVA